jgi:predicted ATP-grasp superfamily ATP-dependent carboligase
MKNKIQAVVLGRNYTSLLGMIRAAGQAGCEVTVIRTVRRFPSTSRLKKFVTGGAIDSNSKYVKKHMYAIEPDRKGLIDKIIKEFETTTEKVILLPTDDFTASTIDLFQDLLNEKFLFPNIDHRAGAVVDIMDKGTQKKLAVEAGLNVAKGWVANKSEAGYEVPENIEYPCFTKPEISFMGNKTYMKRCDSETELVSLLNEIAGKSGNKDCPILIEQYIEIEREFGVLGFSDGENITIPAFVHKMEMGHGSHRGVTLLGKVISSDEFPELKIQLEQFIKKIKFVGLFDIDLYQNGDRIYFNELNLRFGAFGYAITLSGINLPELCIQTLYGMKSKKPLARLEKSTVCLNDKVNLEDYQAGYISWKEYKRTYQQADYRFIKSEEDPETYRAFRKRERCMRLIRFIKR